MAPLPQIVNLPANSITEVDFGDGSTSLKDAPSVPDDGNVPLGALKFFKGDWIGRGFNNIFRPNNGGKTSTTFPVLDGPPIPEAPNNNVLELNLMEETLSFSAPLGQIPNRGSQTQEDIFLNGIPYVQNIRDIANKDTGKADNFPGTGIHFEPGLWMYVPKTDENPKLGDTLCRMASIPHGTTINAQGFNTDKPKPGPPPISPVDITPFPINGTQKDQPKFPSQNVEDSRTARLPQDLTNFIREGTITQAVLDNPTLVLTNAFKHQNVIETTTFKVSSLPLTRADPKPDPNKLVTETITGGGTANIAFLRGTDDNSPNSNAAQFQSTFWIEKIGKEIKIPPCSAGDVLKITPEPHDHWEVVPTFEVSPKRDIPEPIKISLTYHQIQYSQRVLLDFDGLSWPHFSLATLVPARPIKVDHKSLH